MQDNSVKPLIDEARRCDPALIGHWLEWVRQQFGRPYDEGTLSELRALQAELEVRKRDAEPPHFLGGSTVSL